MKISLMSERFHFIIGIRVMQILLILFPDTKNNNQESITVDLQKQEGKLEHQEMMLKRNNSRKQEFKETNCLFDSTKIDYLQWN